MSLTLYQLHACPYCMRVRIVLDDKALPYTSVPVDLANKPAALFAKNPRGRVPVLVDGDTVVYESRILGEYLDEAYPAPPLMPSAPTDRAQVRLLVDLCDNELAVPAYRLALQTFLRDPLAPVDQALKDQAINDVAAALDRVSAALGDGPFLVGDFSLADVAFAPWVCRLALHDFPAERVPENIRGWAARLSERPSVAANVLA